MSNKRFHTSNCLALTLTAGLTYFIPLWYLWSSRTFPAWCYFFSCNHFEKMLLKKIQNWGNSVLLASRRSSIRNGKVTPMATKSHYIFLQKKQSNKNKLMEHFILGRHFQSLMTHLKHKFIFFGTGLYFSVAFLWIKENLIHQHMYNTFLSVDFMVLKDCRGSAQYSLPEEEQCVHGCRAQRRGGETCNEFNLI